MVFFVDYVNGLIECSKVEQVVASSFAITNTLKMAEKGVFRPMSI